MDTFAAGFADPVFDAQRSFRTALDALSRPGRLMRLPVSVTPPPGLDAATATLLLTLADFETPVWLPPHLRDEAGAWLRFHAGAPLADAPSSAAFAVLTGASDEPGLGAFGPGNDLYPDSSTTVFLHCPALEGGGKVSLRGPGIEHEAMIDPIIEPANFWQDYCANAALYPRGVDIVLTSADALIGLPRSLAAHLAETA